MAEKNRLIELLGSTCGRYSLKELREILGEGAEQEFARLFNAEIVGLDENHKVYLMDPVEIIKWKKNYT